MRDCACPSKHTAEWLNILHSPKQLRPAEVGQAFPHISALRRGALAVLSESRWPYQEYHKGGAPGETANARWTNALRTPAQIGRWIMSSSV